MYHTLKHALTIGTLSKRSQWDQYGLTGAVNIFSLCEYLSLAHSLSRITHTLYMHHQPRPLLVQIIRSRTTLKFWSATMFGAAARNFGLVHKFELPTVIADSLPRATRVFSLASVGHVTGHMVPNARCWPPYWKIFTVNNLATVF